MNIREVLDRLILDAHVLPHDAFDYVDENAIAGLIDKYEAELQPALIDPAEYKDYKGETVLVELTYAGEQEFNGHLAYNENTGRLIVLGDNPIMYRK